MPCLAALGKPVGTLPDLLAEVLVHEWRYWDRMARGLGHDEETRDELREALRRSAVILTLLGGVAEEVAARELARRVLPPGATESRVGTLFHLLERLYGTDAGEERFLQGLEPDLLGEELVRQGLARQPELLSLALELGTEPGWRQLLTVLARLARRPESAVAAEGWLQQAYTQALESLAEVALDVAVAQCDPVGLLLAPVLERQASAVLGNRLRERCDHSELKDSTPLREVALVVTEQSVEESRKITQAAPGLEAQAELAKRLRWLGKRQSDLGQREPALEATQEAVGLYRRLAEQRPDAFLPNLATSLINLGLRRSALGQREDALEATQEALLLLRPFFLRHPAAFGLQMTWIKTSYEEATAALGKEPNRELLAEIEEVLNSVTVS